MNRLKQSIVYHYMFVSAVLVMSSVYVWGTYKWIIPWSFDHMFDRAIFNELFLGGIAWITQIILFTSCAYWFYQKVSKDIEEEKNHRLKEQNQLFANIAHDLKNPMTTVVGLSRALEEDIIAEEKRKSTVHIITEKAQHMDKIINLMFQYAKMDTNSYKLHKSEIDVVRLLKEFAAQRYHEFEEKEMELDIQVPDSPVIFCLNRLEMARVINNLITNAIRHNEKGTRVQIGLTTDAGHLKVWISDSGQSIPKNMQQTIFEPFICGDESRNTKGGSGLGLAITKKIVEKHGGEIWIDEQVSGYTKAFVLTLRNST
ncbi:sensor histidine kinase [Priestia koreensis]|uniref:histidine kinase n=1 Tax=Priestia koreensis TaxID=284581 RepID=A0A0M0LPQ4_9BACI|nr:HAMP domain-containing sensor histidine kinase [Priestia koreensis]KOO52713.1 hypothetical protein AMD01_00010 [Priestia koreensis]